MQLWNNYFANLDSLKTRLYRAERFLFSHYVCECNDSLFYFCVCKEPAETPKGILLLV
jgi:hypothetical protein